MRTVSTVKPDLLARLYDVDPALTTEHQYLPSIDSGDLDRMQMVLERVCLDRSYQFRKLSLPNLDRVIEEIAKPALFSIDLSVLRNLGYMQASSTGSLIIASEFYTQGGHRVVAEALLEDESNSLLMTDAFQKYRKEESSVVIPRLPKSRLAIINASSVEDRVRDIVGNIASRKPQECILLLHPQDIAGFIACTMLAKVIPMKFIHHNDHSPTLGIHLECFIHVDLFQFQADFCNAVYEVPKNVLSPRGEPEGAITFDQNSHCEIIVCGGVHKFAENGFALYQQVMRELLNIDFSVTIHHVGTLPDSLVHEIRRHPRAKGRYFYHGEIEQLDSFYRERKNPIYIGSFPVAGGYSTLSALKYGVPVITYAPTGGNILSKLPLLGFYPSASPVWETPAELTEAIYSVRKNYSKLVLSSSEHYANFINKRV